MGSLHLLALLLGLQRCFAAVYDGDEPVKGKAHCVLLSIPISSSFVGSESDLQDCWFLIPAMRSGGLTLEFSSPVKAGSQALKDLDLISLLPYLYFPACPVFYCCLFHLHVTDPGRDQL